MSFYDPVGSSSPSPFEPVQFKPLKGGAGMVALHDDTTHFTYTNKFARDPFEVHVTTKVDGLATRVRFDLDGNLKRVDLDY